MTVMRRNVMIRLAVVMVAVLGLGIAVPPDAVAQTGAKGSAYDRRVLDANSDGSRVQLWSGGWAVNLRTIPVQTVMAKVWTTDNVGSLPQLVYTSGEHVANGSQFDQFGSAAIPKGYRKYTFAWKSVTFSPLYHGYPTIYFKVCYYAHDKGSRGGWTTIYCGSRN